VSTLKIDTDSHEHTLTVRLGGEFDLSGIRDFRRALMDVRAPEVTTVCVDLREPLIQRVFEMTGVDARLALLEAPPPR
jgi:hypothetical protein